MPVTLSPHRLTRLLRVLHDPAAQAVVQRYLDEVAQGRPQEALHHLAQRFTRLPLPEQERLVTLYWMATDPPQPGYSGTGGQILPFRLRPTDR